MHLVKQAQKPNVNRKERWEGEEEEGNSPLHIPVNKDKSLSSDFKIIFCYFIFFSRCFYILVTHGSFKKYLNDFRALLM